MKPALFFLDEEVSDELANSCTQYWFRVDGGKIRVKKLQFRKYPYSYRRGGAWGLSV